jgi:hypothetical protein
MVLMTEPRPLPPPSAAPGAAGTPWLCPRCRRAHGVVIAGILHEPGGDRSALPCVRRCKSCGRRNIKLQ